MSRCTTPQQTYALLCLLVATGDAVCTSALKGIATVATSERHGAITVGWLRRCGDVAVSLRYRCGIVAVSLRCRRSVAISYCAAVGLCPAAHIKARAVPALLCFPPHLPRYLDQTNTALLLFFCPVPLHSLQLLLQLHSALWSTSLPSPRSTTPISTLLERLTTLVTIRR
jgi:hypothetical protein